MSEINVTPFVDVMLVLLIVFMITAPLLDRGRAGRLPKTKAQPLTQAGGAAGDLGRCQGRVIYIQETSVPLENLVPRLIAITGNNADTRHLSCAATAPSTTAASCRSWATSTPPAFAGWP